MSKIPPDLDKYLERLVVNHEAFYRWASEKKAKDVPLSEMALLTVALSDSVTAICAVLREQREAQAGACLACGAPRGSFHRVGCPFRAVVSRCRACGETTTLSHCPACRGAVKSVEDIPPPVDWVTQPDECEHEWEWLR